MAHSPEHIDLIIVDMARNKASARLKTSVDLPKTQGNIVSVRGGSQQLTYRIVQGVSHDERGIPLLGGDSWVLQELEVRPISLWREWFGRLWKTIGQNKAIRDRH